MSHFFMDTDPIVHWEGVRFNNWGLTLQKRKEHDYHGIVYQYHPNRDDPWHLASWGSHRWEYCPDYCVPKRVQLYLALIQ